MSTVLHYPKNQKVEPKWRAKRLDPFGFFKHPLLRNINKLEGDPLGIFFPKKILTMPKKLKGGTL